MPVGSASKRAVVPPRPTAPPKRTAPLGRVTAIVAVTGVEDEVQDVIVPGAFARTLLLRKPKVVFHHDWTAMVGRCVTVEEWRPGDPRLPKRTKDGRAWPKEAGALVATMQFDMRLQKARDVFELVRFYTESNECEFSIGYKVVENRVTRRADGVRVIYDLDLYECSPVLFGAAPLSMSLEVKAAAHSDLEWKGTGVPHVGAAAGAVLEVKAVAKAEPKVAGVAVVAKDTGRVLMLQRALDDTDPASGMWEFPGGHVEGTESPWEGASREFQEETGMALPKGQPAGQWDSPNGVYRGFVHLVPSEGDVPINKPHDDRTILNPDDPDGDNVETVAWWDPRHLDHPIVRREVRTQTPKRKLTHPQVETKAAARAVLESKAGGGDRNRGGAENLRHWFVEGKGAALIGWGTAGDFDRCVSLAGKHMTPADAKGYCNLRHKEATGEYPATHAAQERHLEGKTAPTETETKGMPQPQMSGSFEERRSLLQEAVRDLLAKDDSGACVCLEATYDDHCIVSKMDGADTDSYLIPYVFTAGSVSLGAAQPVSLSVVATPTVDSDEGGEIDGDEADLVRFIVPAAAAMSDATNMLRLSGPLEAKYAGDIRTVVASLLSVLESKGLPMDQEDMEDGGDDEAAEGEAPVATKGAAVDPGDYPPPSSDGGDDDTEADDPWLSLLPPEMDDESDAPEGDGGDYTDEGNGSDGGGDAPVDDVAEKSAMDTDPDLDGDDDSTAEGDTDGDVVHLDPAEVHAQLASLKPDEEDPKAA